MSDVVEEVELEGGVLVGHDGSAASQEAVRWAADLAVKLDKPLHVLRAWVMVTAPRPKSHSVGYVAPLTDYEAAVREDLESDCRAFDLPGDVHFHVVHGRSARELMKASRGADMVVIGRRGGGGFRGLRFGSTADQVVRYAPCPVVVVPVTATEE